MKVWVTRESKTCFWCINIWTNKKSPAKDGEWWNGSSTFLSEEHTCFSFKKKFGFTPRKGTCKQYNLTLEEIK